MGALFESAFDISYLIAVFTLGVLILRGAPSASGSVTARLAGWQAIVLGFGDSFHLLARVWALNTTGLEAHYVPLGYGKLVSALTMTAFYVLVYQFILRRWPTAQEERAKDARHLLGPNPRLSAVVYAAAIATALLLLLPQNQIFTPQPPVLWGAIRNIPFVVMGVIVIAQFWERARRDTCYRFAWLAVTLSFAFYVPVVLWSQQSDAVGLLMIPKTLAYVWLVTMGFRAFAGAGDKEPVATDAAA